MKKQFRFLATLLTLGLLLTGCGNLADRPSPEERTTLEFFDLLQDSQARHAADLLDTSITGDLEYDDVLEDEFYAAAIAHPREPRVAGSEQQDSGETRVNVEYTLDGEEQKTYVLLRDTSDGPRITQVGAMPRMEFSGPYHPGTLKINGMIETKQLVIAPPLWMLPGTYRFEYIDPSGVGILDPTDDSSPEFEVNFPLEASERGETLASGVTLSAAGLHLSPRVSEKALESVEKAVLKSIEKCEKDDFKRSSCTFVEDKIPKKLKKAESITWSVPDDSEPKVIRGDDWIVQIPLKAEVTNKDGKKSSSTYLQRGVLSRQGNSFLLTPAHDQ